MHITKAVMIGFVMALPFAFSPAHAAGAEKRDIVDTAATAGQFDTLVAAVKAAGLVDSLKAKGPFTLFAPTDAAFDKLPNGTIDNLMKPENKQKLASILNSHVIAGKVSASEIAGKDLRVPTIEGRDLVIDATSNKVSVEGATVEQADIETTNGVIHAIDTVIMPKS